MNVCGRRIIFASIHIAGNVWRYKLCILSISVFLCCSGFHKVGGSREGKEKKSLFTLAVKYFASMPSGSWLDDIQKAYQRRCDFVLNVNDRCNQHE